MLRIYGYVGLHRVTQGRAIQGCIGFCGVVCLCGVIQICTVLLGDEGLGFRDKGALALSLKYLEVRGTDSQ